MASQHLPHSEGQPFYGGTYFPPEDRVEGQVCRACSLPSPMRIEIDVKSAKQEPRSDCPYSPDHLAIVAQSHLRMIY